MRPSGVKTVPIPEEIGFNALDKFKRATGALLQLQQALHRVRPRDLSSRAGFAVLFISPVRGNTHLRHLIHIFVRIWTSTGTPCGPIIEVRTTDSRSLLEWRCSLSRDPDAAYTGYASGQDAITGVGIIDDHAESVDVHDRAENAAL